MYSTDLSPRSCDGRAVVALRGELDLADAAAVAAALTAVAAREPQTLVDPVYATVDEAGHTRERALDVAV